MKVTLDGAINLQSKTRCNGKSQVTGIESILETALTFWKPGLGCNGKSQVTGIESTSAALTLSAADDEAWCNGKSQVTGIESLWFDDEACEFSLWCNGKSQVTGIESLVHDAANQAVTKVQRKIPSNGN